MRAIANSESEILALHSIAFVGPKGKIRTCGADTLVRPLLKLASGSDVCDASGPVWCFPAACSELFHYNCCESRSKAADKSVRPMPEAVTGAACGVHFFGKYLPLEKRV